MYKGLRKKMIDYDMKKSDLAKEIGISEAWLSAIMTGKGSFSLEHIKKIKQIFNLTNDETVTLLIEGI